MDWGILGSASKIAAAVAVGLSLAAWLAQDALIFYRSKSYHVQGGFQGEESLRVVGREVRSSRGYYEEHLLGEGIGTFCLRASGIPVDGLLDTLAAAGCENVQRADASRVIPELKQVPPEVAVELLPAVGLALRRVA